MIESGAVDPDTARLLLEQEQATTMQQASMFMGLGRVGQEMFLEAFRRQTLERTTITLSDGTTGYFERGMRTDDCFAAALATCLKVPIGEVPDPRIDERLQAGEDAEAIARSSWQELAEWLTARGLLMNVHAQPPVELPRWIGIVRFPGSFNDHTLVMSRDEVLFDPVDRSRHSRRVKTFSVADVSGGFSFEPQRARSGKRHTTRKKD